MFRGEPVPIWTLMMGITLFLLTQLFGVFTSGFLQINLYNPLQGHFLLAFLGWIAFMILGAQLQFFRAITGLRKYEPETFRWIFLISLPLGLFLLILGTSVASKPVLISGFLVYSIALIIHSYWLLKQWRDPKHKFPLNYFIAAQAFFLLGFIQLFYLSITGYSSTIAPISSSIHIFGIGWITLTLQGALIRVLPMFLGHNIDRKLRTGLNYHFYTSVMASFFFIVTYYIPSGIIKSSLHGLGGILWEIAWIWALLILFKSIFGSKKPIDHKETLLYTGMGLIWFLIGSNLGLILAFFPGNKMIYLLHIHVTLLLGLSLIILGAFHRIHIFQIYTFLFTGRRNVISMDAMFHRKIAIFCGILFNINPIFIIYGFAVDNFWLVGLFGTINIVITLVYLSIPTQNLILYFKERKNAIPFYLKPTELHS